MKFAPSPLPLSRLAGSSTFWVAILLPALNLWAARNGLVIPWEVVLTGVGAYGAKEAAGKLGSRSVAR